MRRPGRRPTRWLVDRTTGRPIIGPDFTISREQAAPQALTVAADGQASATVDRPAHSARTHALLNDPIVRCCCGWPGRTSW